MRWNRAVRGSPSQLRPKRCISQPFLASVEASETAYDSAPPPYLLKCSIANATALALDERFKAHSFRHFSLESLFQFPELNITDKHGVSRGHCNDESGKTVQEPKLDNINFQKLEYGA